jgi:hypothetical protein
MDRCLKTGARHAPSYVELLICLEPMRDMQKRQQQEKSAAGRPQSRSAAGLDAASVVSGG